MALPTTARSPAKTAADGRVALARRSLNHWLVQYRQVWKGTIFSTFLEPLGFLAAMGLGLGALVDDGVGSTALGGVGYLEFIAPGLLAATAMQSASFESTYPVLGAIKWHGQYFAMLASPLRVVDILTGHLMFVAIRQVMTTTVFLGVMFAFGAVESPLAILAMPVAVLTGMAYATAIFGFAATQEADQGFSMLYRFGIVPMFLFSGTFFPISQLPDWLEPVAWVTPVWHGVELCRDLALGEVNVAAAALHITYLVVWTMVAFVVSYWSFKRRLIK